MKYSEVKRTVQQLRDLADFIEQRGVEIPGYLSIGTSANCYLTETDYIQDEVTNEWNTVLNEDKTKENIRRFLKVLGSCDKDYQNDRIAITKNNSIGTTMIRGTVDRSVACKRVVTGTKFVQAQLVPARMEEEVEWVCDENISLLKLVS